MLWSIELKRYYPNVYGLGQQLAFESNVAQWHKSEYSVKSVDVTTQICKCTLGSKVLKIPQSVGREIRLDRSDKCIQYYTDGNGMQGGKHKFVTHLAKRTVDSIFPDIKFNGKTQPGPMIVCGYGRGGQLSTATNTLWFLRWLLLQR